MIDPIIIAKLEGLVIVLKAELSNPDHRNYGGSKIINLFERYDRILDELSNSYSSLFSDITKIPIPEKHPANKLPISRNQIESLLADIKMVLEMIRSFSKQTSIIPEVTREGIYFAGQTFDALRAVQTLIGDAKNSIWLIDNYIDSPILDLFISKKDGVILKIITTKLQPDFKKLAGKFNEQYGNLEIYVSSAFHDRFLCIDEKYYYHFGASIKDVGKKGFMFSRIEETNIMSSLKDEINKIYNTPAVQL